MNVFTQLRDLLAPPSPMYRVKVLEHRSDGTSRVQFPGTGPQAVVRGQSVAVNDYAFIQSGEIKQQAPELDEITMDV